MGQKRKGSTWRNLLGIAVLALTAACSSGDGITSSEPVIPLNQDPLFAAGTPANGPGQCLLEDVVDAGFINSGDVNCTSEDVDVALATASTYSVNDGPFVTLASTGGKVLCSPGDKVEVITSAQVINHAQERYDVGLWVGLSGGDALTGSSCNHYNLVPGANLSTNIDGDQCGDVQANVTVEVPLGELTLSCTDGDPSAAVALIISACAGWQNHVGGTDRICPTGSGGSFRLGTTPETPAKCKCEPLSIPLDIRGSITIIKNAVPDDAQDFTFATTGAGLTNPFTLDDDPGSAGTPNTVTFPNLVAGSYSVDEAAVAGWALTGLVCNSTGSGTSTTTDLATGVANITLGAGGTVTCTYTNTKQASITVAKVCVGGTGTFDFTGTVPAGASAISPFTRTCGQSAEVVAPTTAFGNYTITEAAETGFTLTDLVCTGGGANTSDAGSVATVGLDAGENVTCTFTNTAQATITVAKVCVGGTGTFDFTGTVPAGASAISPFTRTCGQSAQVVAPTTAFGNYTITEAAETGFALTDLVCTGGGANTSDAGSVATIGLDAGENVTCTFTNTAAASITVAKVCVGTGGTFDFTATVPAGATPVAPFTRTCGASASIVTTTSAFGTYTITEAAETGWVLTDLVCTGGGANTSDAGSVATVGLEAGETVVCTFTNTATATITVAKVCVGGTATFDFTGTVPAGGSAIAPFTRTCAASAQVVAPTTVFGNYTITEAAETGWVLTDLVCTGGGANTSDAGSVATIGLDAGENVTCTFTNTKQATVQVIKTVNTAAITGSETFTFTLRTGANATTVGTIRETIVANSTNGGTLNFTFLLTPGTSYQICEVVLPGWLSSISGLAGAFTIQTEPDGDNSTICVAFTPTAGQNVVFNIDNTPPPGGDARTIGFWKNWSSCTKGNQDDVLDETLATFAGGGVLIGDLFVNTCAEAFAILNKSDLSGKKKASDPAFNMAAQLLAAKLNIQAGAGSCAAANTAIAAGQALLDAINFNGTTHTTMSAAQITEANALAETLDSYNNNNLCP